MNPLSRRACLKQTALASAAYAIPAMFRASPAPGVESVPADLSEAEKATVSEIAWGFLEQFHAPGISVAISVHGQIVYREAFGFADPAKREPLTPAHLFRIASVSKPITATCLFSYIEQGKLALNDLVFGPGGLLRADFGDNHPANVNAITLHHLLTHTAGGWEKGRNDPMFASPALGHKELIERTLSTVPLQYSPGAHFGYSNFGYCILGRVIEKISGLSYVEAVRQAVLSRCGITTMQLAGNTLAQRAKGEVVYYGQDGETPYWMNVARMDSHGGWIASASDLVEFALRVDDFDPPPDILRHETLQRMVTATPANAGYACGWAVNRENNWWHSGSLPGVSTIMARTSRGLCWAALTNTRTAAKGIDLALDQLVWKMVKAVPAWGA
jgi:CubicO group peptidase (beta-lactamase class C family)